ncbi:HET-domain-containing protein [Bimuria novae-zelandiae CBS 107.79]|uniref:HET-domain-containing protein n=1 Tax=Bimuria novae-zelandiae CBS 107.79 TaxID=1447943 RepID=A0A6A5V263_9PLEO|nr:HET-domain-containing protein [Bimuria novae-zelandiae CBS 107.79]
MRLLTLRDDDQLSLDEFPGDDIPTYTILSHTRGTDHKEVTFKDIIKGRGKDKAGYSKILFYGRQAAKDGLQYFWVDTCCIDKSSSAELQDATNSMFRWFQDAAKCYVYLSDVAVSSSIGRDLSSQRTWKPVFLRSRWFTRVWTLQELIAPKSVEFFSAEGELLGDKNSLFSVNETMSWAERRETKRKEDAVYSLLGLFDIHMPLIYGEGRKKAFIMLQKEINQTLKAECE